VETKKGLTIIEFAAENFMKLKAVRIRPDGANMVVLSGKNGAGKSSILNAIMAVVDKAALKKQGITKLLREGQERGFVKIDLGDIIAKLTLTERGEYLTVENKEGMAFKSPAGVMDRLRGMISFDPLAFAKMDAKKQKDILLGLVDVGIDLDVHDKERARIFDERTNVGRKRDELKGKLADLPNLPADLPENEVPLSSVSEERRQLEAVKAENDTRRKEYSDLKERYQSTKYQHEAARLEWEQIEAQIKELRGKQDVLFQKGQHLAKEVQKIEESGKGLKAAVDALVDPDFSILDTRLEEIEQTNQAVREKNRREHIRQEANLANISYVRMTDELSTLDKKKTDALAAAKFPVEGLGFNAEGITFNGLPLDHASDGEKLTVSVAIGMALNPELRVLWFNHGEMLDSDNWAIIEKLAGSEEYQVWAERMSEDPSVGIHIVDGEISGEVANG